MWIKSHVKMKGKEEKLPVSLPFPESLSISNASPPLNTQVDTTVMAVVRKS